VEAGSKPEGRLVAAYRRSWLGPRGGTILGWVALVAVLAWFQGQASWKSLQTGLLPFRINDDAQQQIFPFFRYLKPNAFANDYIADYYLACYPLGYRGLYAVAAQLGIDPTQLSHWLPHLLWLLTLLGLGAVAHKLGGRLAVLCAVGLALGSNVYLGRIAGGLPRSFGFPILAGSLVALAYARVWWCAACVLCGALFYPVTGIISGLSLAGWLLLPRQAGLGPSSWRWSRRLTVLAGTAALAILLLLPSAVSCGRFGAVVRPWETSEFPEAGPGGRYSSESRAPFAGFFASSPRALDAALLGGEKPWSAEARRWLLEGQRKPRQASHYRALIGGLLVLGLLGWLGLLIRQPAARRVLLLGIASGIGYTVASLVAPYAYLPERYVAYSVPLLGTLVVATALAGLLPASLKQGWQRWARTLAMGGYVAALLWLLGGRVASRAGLSVDLRQEKPLFAQIAALPENALVAGWPKGAMNRVPYASRRRVLLNHEVHQAFHKDYIAEMRRRMRALIDAYFATSVEPILRLRDEFGVTHLLIDRSHFKRKPPGYFQPYRGWIAERSAAARGRRFELPRQIAAASVYSYKSYELLELDRIELPRAERDVP
jgi:hypothetical protein